ncbi:MAG: PEGA domain-containing protein [candidate division KSB1 bacterium]|nr:PEGA domain-containing protein [candidate division KSB1 bacterium]MDZ7302106.1 PEGA domain-containing protein [candidate division KSB1 bacterium]MDZ7311147.1 PEGA domain-containing protein [candidate division KSB1 bacterium]
MHRSLVLLCLLLPAFVTTAWSQPGYYRVTVQPGGVRLFINDAPADSAGMLDPGIYSLRIEKPGYRTVTRKVRIESDRVLEIRVRLWPAKIKTRPQYKRYDVRLRQTTASLILSSNPPGLPIRLNDDDKGMTPLRLDDVPTGSYRITIGTVTDNIWLQQDELRRLRLERGKIQDVTKEIYDTNFEHVRLHNLALFMEEDEARACDCSLFRGRRGANVFHPATAGMFLIARMIFRNSSETTISIPLRFSIYRDGKLFSRAKHTLNIKSGRDHDWCYYHHDYWETGEYTLTVESVDGHRWGVVHFRIYLE